MTKPVTATPAPQPPVSHRPPAPHSLTVHLLERLHQFLFIVIIRDALDSGEGLPAVPLLDPYMDVVLSAGRKQVITLTCISKGVCGESASAPAPPRRAPIGPPARPSDSGPALSPPPPPAADATRPRSAAAPRGGAAAGRGRRARPGPAPHKGLTEGLEVLDSGHTIRFPSLGEAAAAGGGGGGDAAGGGGGASG